MNSLSSFPPLFYNLSFVTSVGTNHPPFQKSLAQTLQQHHSLLNTKHSTLTSLTSWCLQYISHILPHSGVHLFHSLFLLLIRNTYTSPPDCPEHPYNIHYPFSITSISSTQQTQPSHKQPHTKQHLSNSFPFTHPAQHQTFTLTLPHIPQHNPPWLPDIQRTFYYSMVSIYSVHCSSYWFEPPSLFIRIARNSLTTSFIHFYISYNKQHNISLPSQSHPVSHIFSADSTLSPLSTYSSPCTLWIWMWCLSKKSLWT